MSSSETSVTLLIVNNIPKSYHTVDLRNFFSEFIETESFHCFHFRHRPEIKKQAGSESKLDSAPETCCCMLYIYSAKATSFISTYDSSHWISKSGESLKYKCIIRRIRVANKNGGGSTDDGTDEVVTQSQLATMLEFRPPEILPRGNVGTPTRLILDFVRQCKFPPRLIAQLGIVFPRFRSKGVYGSVPFKYGSDVIDSMKSLDGANNDDDDDEFPRSRDGHLISKVYNPPEALPALERDKKEDSALEQQQGDSDSDDGEEWDRHQALHDDITSQERTKERLFEEEQEVVWDKGSSGLVFYTDAQYWDEKEGDFDAKTADDWDVDMSVYYEDGAGDKDARDFVSMRHFDRLRDGCEEEDENRQSTSKLSTVETFGRKMMTLQGWKAGSGLGAHSDGISEPIEDSGKHPSDRSGFGYRGERLQRHPRRRRKRKRGHRDDDDECDEEDVYRVRISTVYDNPDAAEPPLRSNPPSFLAFRKPFVPGGRLFRETELPSTSTGVAAIHFVPSMDQDKTELKLDVSSSVT